MRTIATLRATDLLFPVSGDFGGESRRRRDKPRLGQTPGCGAVLHADHTCADSSKTDVNELAAAPTGVAASQCHYPDGN